jgi:hypothetical protein
MATYGRGQMLGSGINPESFKQDYSGFANAAATQAQGVANLGANIGGAIAEVGDYFKKQAEDEKKVQKSLSVAKAIGDLIPGLQPTIQGSLNILNDKELPLSQRTAEADAISDILNLGINEVRNRQDVGFKERELGIREAEALARNTPSMPTVNRKRVEKTGVFNGKTLKYDIYVDPNNPSDAIYEDGTSVYNEGSQTPARIDAALNAGIPSNASDAERKSIQINNALEIPNANDTVEVNPSLLTDFIPLPDGMPVVTDTPAPNNAPTTTQAPVVDEIPAGQAGGAMIPPGATPVVVDGMKSFRRATPEEAAGYGATAGQIDEQTNRFYPINLPSGMTVESDGQGGIKVVQGSGVGAKADQQQKAVDSKIDKAMALTQDLNLLENRMQSMAPGVSGAVGRIVAEQIPATSQAENKEIIDRVIATLTLENLQAMRNNNPTGASLGNISDKDTALLRSSATSLKNSQSPESFKRELVRLKNLQHDVIYGSERVLKQKLEKGEITKTQFDEAMANAPSEYLDEKGEIKTRTLTRSKGSIPRSEEVEALRQKYLTPPTQ